MARGLSAFLAAAVIAVASVGAGTLGPDTAHAQQAKPKKKGLKGSIGYRRAYSYSKQSIVGWESRRFYDDSLTLQTPGGPFDSGFFFDSAISRHGGNAPYQQ